MKMICLESHAANYSNSNQEQCVGDKQDDSDCEKEDEGHTSDGENTTAEFFVRLTDMVRGHYCGYLEKQLLENVQIWRENKSKESNADTGLQPREKAALEECCRVLEDRALKACMHARRYQRSMLKIIAEVRRSTQEFRLNDQLRKLITADEGSRATNQSVHKQKSTQTDESMFFIKEFRRKLTTEEDINNKSSPCSLSLQQKIEMFQDRLNQEAKLKVAVKHKECYKRTSRHSSHKPLNDEQHVHHHRNSIRTYDKPNKVPRCMDVNEKEGGTTPLPSTVPVILEQDATIEIPNQITASSISTESADQPLPTASVNCVTGQLCTVENDLLEQDDEIAKELAQLFCEEKSDLEELLGLNSIPEIDDPQVRSVFEEIENAPLSYETTETLNQSTQRMDSSPEKQQRYTSQTKLNGVPQISSSPFENVHEPTSSQHHHLSSGHTERPVANLKHSLWPCELYMQRRRLTASLSRLIEEDFRWHDLIQWKFHTLFGEDSDDEFAPCSPSIELDEVLICSCIKRISPWMVNHLMKPMRDGLIANRFLFKKLAKRLAHSIVLENQYPDERFIKHAVEEYFCLHQAVVSLEDMADMPNLNTINDK